MNSNLQIYFQRYKRNLKNGFRRFSSTNPALIMEAGEIIPRFSGLIGSVKCIYNRDSFQQRMIEDFKNRPIIYSEALIKTYPSKLLKREIFKRLEKKLSDWQFGCTIEVDGEMKNVVDYYYDESNYDSDDIEKRTAGNVQIVIPIKDPSLSGKQDISKAEFKVELDKLMNFFGYDYSSCSLYDCQFDAYYDRKIIPLVVLIVLQYEAKYQTDVIVPNKFLYHLTTSEKLQKILRNGISPKSQSVEFEYDSRVYLFNCDRLDIMCKYALESQKKTKEWFLLQIDPKRIPNLKLYVDNSFDVEMRGDVVFTPNNISPNAIISHRSFQDKINQYQEALEVQ